MASASEGGLNALTTPLTKNLGWNRCKFTTRASPITLVRLVVGAGNTDGTYIDIKNIMLFRGDLTSDTVIGSAGTRISRTTAPQDSNRKYQCG